MLPSFPLFPFPFPCLVFCVCDVCVSGRGYAPICVCRPKVDYWVSSIFLSILFFEAVSHWTRISSLPPECQRAPELLRCTCVQVLPITLVLGLQTYANVANFCVCSGDSVSGPRAYTENIFFHCAIFTAPFIPSFTIYTVVMSTEIHENEEDKYQSWFLQD